MISPCPNRQVCLGDQPGANLSSEAPDLPVYIGQNTGWDNNKPPIGGDWTVSRCFINLESTVSQEAADTQAAVEQLLCLVNPAPGNAGFPRPDRNGRSRNVGPTGWHRPDPSQPGFSPPEGPVAPNGPNIQTFNSEEESCTATCPSGTGQVSHKSEAGQYIGLTQNFANTVAQTWACIKAYDELMCIGVGRLIGSHCQGSDVSCTITVSGKHPPFRIETVGTLPDGLKLNQNQAALATLSGTLEKAGDFQWTYKATDSQGHTVLSNISQLSVAGFLDDTDIDYPDGETHQDYIWDFKAAHQGKTTVTVPTGCTLNDSDLTKFLQQQVPDVVQEQWNLQNIPNYLQNNIAALNAFVAAGGTLTPGQQLKLDWMNNGAPLDAIADCKQESKEVNAVVFTGNDLPPGLVLTEDGVLAGVPVKTGVYTMHIHIEDSVARASCDFFLDIAIHGELQQFEWCAHTPGFSFEINPTFAPDGIVQWSTDGLPTWLQMTVHDNGLGVTIHGDADRANDDFFAVTAAITALDPVTGLYVTTTLLFPCEVGVLGLTEDPPALPKALPGKAYHYTFHPLGDIFPPYTFGIVSGNFPNGMALNPNTGEITGSPSGVNAGVYTFVLQIRSSVTGFLCRISVNIEVLPKYVDWSQMTWQAPVLVLTSGLHPAADASADQNAWQGESNSGIGGAGQSSTYQDGILLNPLINGTVPTPSKIDVTEMLRTGSASWSISLNGAVVLQSGTGIFHLEFTAQPGHNYEIEVRTLANAVAGPPPNVVQITGLVDLNIP